MKLVRNSIILFLGLLLILLISLPAPGENLSPKQLYRKASNCFNKADYVNALEIFIELVEGYPQSTLAPPSQYQIAVIYLDKLKYREEGIRELKGFLSLYPSDSLAPKVYYELTKRFYESQNYQEALSTAEEALKKIDPHSTYRQNIAHLVPPCLFEVSKSCFDNKEYPIAAEGFQKILTDYPDTKEAKTSLLFLGHCYSSLGKWKEAEKLYSEFLKRYPFSKISAKDYLQIGKTFQKLEQKRRAFLLFDKILKEYPESALAKETKEMMKECLFVKFTTPLGFDRAPLAQDETYLWLGTGSWLSRYDKKTGGWKVYTHDDGIPGNSRITILLKESDAIWIGTVDGGIARLDTKTNAITTFNTSDGLISNDIWGIASDKDYVWVGDGKNISKYDKKLKKWEVLPVPDDFPGSVSLASSGRFLFCSGGHIAKNNSIAKYDILEKRWELLKEDFGRVFFRRPLAVDGDDLWMGHAGVWNEKDNKWEVKKGVVKYNLKDGSTKTYSSQNTGCTEFSDDEISDIKITKDSVCVSSWGSVYRYNKKDDTWKKYYQSGGDDIAVDDNYIYSVKFGLQKTNLETGKKEQVLYLIDLPPVDVQSIWADRDDVWVYSKYEGIRRYNKKTNKWKAYGEKDGIPRDGFWPWPIVKIKIEILAGTKYGVIKYDSNSDKWIMPVEFERLSGKCVTNICNDEKYLWFSLYNEGIARYDKSRKEWRFFPIQDGLFKNVLYLKRDKEYIWAACGADTDVALCQFDKKKQEWKVVRIFKQTETSYPQFRAMGVDENNVWLIIDTNDQKAGINSQYIIERYDKKNNRWTTYKTDFPDFSPQDIVVDKDYIWFFAEGKARCYDKRTGSWIPFPWNEMTGNYCGPTALDGDYLWVGAPSQGVIRFDKKLWFEYSNIFPSDKE